MLDDMSTRMAAQREGTVDAAGWALVARSNAALQRFDKAAEAYARARALAPDDAQLLADHADVLAVLQGGRLTGEPAALVSRALSIDPANQKALALSAVPAPPALQISGRIRVSPEMAGRIEPTDEVFVFAREPGSTGMPIAVARYRADSFPLDFKLDASNVVGTPARLTGLSTLVLGARVSRTGDATPRPGDPRGESAPVPLTGAGRDILIEGAVP
ncbi:MAG: hypothetical protein EOO24_15220 [Comamonadaceae bacterium]|nr:MAG: hypothetical protein EOO24_15220 [Comamonadaceae bacterium]